jgi:DNA mismatch endonuclease (patch repair protein)
MGRDIFSKKKRSEVMSKIRGSNTSIEKIVFSFLRSRGVYFQKHYNRANGCPDIALPRKKIAVFIDGDFWHGYKFKEKKERLLASQQHYWINKIERNIARDRKTRKSLKEAGWKVLRIWEHQLKRRKTVALEKILSFLRQ